MTVKTSSRVAQVKPSATIAVSMKAAELRSQGHDIISLGAGEPDFDTPNHIKKAALEAIVAGQTKYTAVDGTAELKEAIIGKFKRENQLEYEASEIIVSNGAKQCIFNLLQALINNEDEVIVPAPYWVSYPDMVRLADGQAVILTAGIEQDFKITARQLDANISDSTRLLIMNSPSNPTGKCYTRQEFQALGEVLEQHPRVVVVTDDIYEHIYWGESAFLTWLNACPGLRDRMVVVNGVSKAYAMTGWRIGYAAGPTELIKEMRKVQSQSTSNPCSVSQAAACAALNGPQDCVASMRKAFKKRHAYIVNALNALPGVTCPPADGAFYAFPSFQQVIEQLDEVNDDTALAGWFLDQAGVAMVPGSAFGAPGHLRLSFATSMKNLKEAISRLEKALG